MTEIELSPGNEYICRRCKSKTTKLQKMFSNLPKLLVICLTDNKKQGPSNEDKPPIKSRKIEILLSLELEEDRGSGDITKTYSLSLVFRGATKKAGHYVSHCNFNEGENKRRTWLVCDDKIIRYIPEKDVINSDRILCSTSKQILLDHPRGS